MSIKQKLIYTSVFAAIIISLQLLAVAFAYAAPSSETLIDVQDSTVSGTLISGKRVKDAGNIAENSTSGLLSCGSMVYDGTAWDKWTGAVTIGSGSVTVVQPTAASLNATIGNASGASAVNIQDGGNSITVDGTFYQATQPISIVPTTTMNHAQVSIPVTAGGTLLIAANTSRKSLLIQNIGAFAMFCGNTGLSATTGFKVDIGASFFDDTAVFNGAVYCIGSGGTTTAAYREVQ